MSDIKVMRYGVADLHNQLGQRMVDDAILRKKTLSQLLEELNPSDPGDELNAFERQIEHTGITTQTNRNEGYVSDAFDAFNKNEHARVLGAEWIDYIYRSTTELEGAANKRMISSDMTGVDRSLRPILQAASNTPLSPAVPLNAVVAFTTVVDNDSYRAMYVTHSPDQLGQRRVAEGAPIPEARLNLGQRAIDLYKFGRALVVTYEALRRTPIDTVAMYIRMAAIQVEMDKVAEVLRVMLEGDGNTGTAATPVGQTALDPGSAAGTLTVRAWARFKLSFPQPYIMNTELVREDVWLDQLFLPVAADATLGMVPSGALGGFRPINANMANDVAVGVLPQVPARYIVGFDNRFAVQRVVEAGSNINESMRWIRNQTQELTFSENEGYAVIQPQAVKVLNIAG